MILDASRAALLLPGLDAAAAERVVELALRRRGYVRAEGSKPPQGYPLALDEWLALGFEDGLVRFEDVDAVFRVACWASAALPDQPIGAVRGYRGLGPTLKILTDGAPRFRDGHDADLEVPHPVPGALPRGVELGELPGRADAIPPSAFAPWDSGTRTAIWVLGSSRLAP